MLPVVMLSVSGKASTIVGAMRIGAADYLTKPFEEEELDATLREAAEKLSMGRPFAQNTWGVSKTML